MLYLLVKDFKQNEGYRYPDGFIDSLPDYCLDPRCASPMEMSETLTGLHCSNPRCPTKLVRRLVALMSAMGVKDLGASRASAFIDRFGLTNPLFIFAYEPDADGAIGEGISLETSKKIYSQIVEKNSFTLWEYVRNANLPFVQTSAMHIFSDFDSLEDAYKAIEDGGYEYVRNKLSIKKGSSDDLLDNSNISLRALRVFESLMTFKTDLFEALPYVKIKKTHGTGMRVLKAVCSEEVGEPFVSKSAFYTIANNRHEDIHIDFLSGVTKAIDYLIWAGADGVSNVRVTNKVQKVRKYNETYELHKSLGKLKDGEHYIPIVTAAQFLHILDRMEDGEL